VWALLEGLLTIVMVRHLEASRKSLRGGPCRKCSLLGGHEVHYPKQATLQAQRAQKEVLAIAEGRRSWSIAQGDAYLRRSSKELNLRSRMTAGTLYQSLKDG